MDDLIADPTKYFRAFAVWLSERTKDRCPWAAIHPASIPGYIGSARSAIEADSIALRVNQKALNRLYLGLEVRHTTLFGAPGPPTKQALTIAMLKHICSHRAWTDACASVATGQTHACSDADFNICMAIAASVIAYVTARRPSSVATPVIAAFNPNLRCTEGDVQADQTSIRIKYKPTKPDRAGTAWRGWSPKIPAVPGNIACPCLALAVRFAILPRSTDDRALFCSRKGPAISPLSSQMMKDLALDRALALANPGVTSVSARHGCASAMVSAGFTEAQIQQWGHWKSTSWMSYASISDEAASTIVLGGLYR
jgi:hypothetical protein